jgi:hypothetical protein
MRTVITQDTPAGTTQIHCPVCHGQNLPGEIIESQETLMENLVVPVARHTTWWVVCSRCKTRLYSRQNAAELQGKTPDDLAGLVYYRVSLVHQFLAVAAVVLAITPGLGVIMGLIAWFVNRKTPGWPQRLSKYALWTAVFLHVAFVVYVFIAASRAPRRPRSGRSTAAPRFAAALTRHEDQGPIARCRKSGPGALITVEPFVTTPSAS